MTATQEQAVAEAVAALPPLTDDQVARVAALLTLPRSPAADRVGAER